MNEVKEFCHRMLPVSSPHVTGCICEPCSSYSDLFNHR